MCRIFIIITLFADLLKAGCSLQSDEKKFSFCSFLHCNNISKDLLKIYTNLYTYGDNSIRIYTKVNKLLPTGTTHSNLPGMSFCYDVTSHPMQAVISHLTLVNPVRINTVGRRQYFYVTEIVNINFNQEYLPPIFDVLYHEIADRFANREKSISLFLLCGLISNISMYSFECNSQPDYNGVIKSKLDTIANILKSMGYSLIKYRRENID